MDSKTDRLLKEKVNVQELFCIYLSQLILAGAKIHSPEIWAYNPTQLDEATRSHLKAKVKTAMAYPKETSAYKFIESGEGAEASEVNALRYVEFASLTVLILLGEKETIPVLLKFLRKNYDSVRARTIASGVLLYVTGQDIGSYFLTERDLDLWEKWWEQSKSMLE